MPVPSGRLADNLRLRSTIGPSVVRARRRRNNIGDVTSPLELASLFPSVDREDWLESVGPVLGSSTFEKKLVTRLASDLSIEPLYDRAGYEARDDLTGLPGSPGYTRGVGYAAGAWDIRQRHDLITASQARTEMLADLEQGATSVLLRLHRAPSAGELAAALDGVYLDMAPIALDAGPWWRDAVEALAAVWNDRDMASAARIGSLRIDPIGVRARWGVPVGDDLPWVTAFVDSPHLATMAVDATPWVDGGAHAVQELGWSLATGVEYLRWLTASGLPVDNALASIEFTYAATSNQFETIAKLRAARRCWSRIATASGGTPIAPVAGQRQHAITSAAMFTTRDPWVNLLRATTAALGAAAGGAQAITVLPFDSAVGRPDELGRRMARNLQLLLLEESNLDKVVDPAGGSWFIEDLTTKMAEAAWAEFQRIEANGGMLAALEGGDIGRRVDASWDAQVAKIASRRTAVVGVSEFPDLTEPPLDRESWPTTVVAGATGEVIPMRRPSEVFESLRDRIERSGAIPRKENLVFGVNLGPPAVHSARLAFATNLFASGGLEVTGNDGFAPDDTDAITASYFASGARIAVICSSDEVYAEHATAVAGALKGAGCRGVWLAGAPGDSRAGFESGGIDRFIHLGCDVVDELQFALTTIGIS